MSVTNPRMKLQLALAILGTAVVANRYELKYGLTLGLILVGGLMLSDTVKGGFDYAGAGLKYMFGRVRGMGLSQFSDEELTEKERNNSIRNFRGTYVGGLWNEGNTCFINSVVQSLASCDSMVELTAKGAAQASLAPFSSDLHHIIHDVNRIKKTHHNYSTSRLMSNVGDNDSRWSRLNQEDAQEFFQGLLLALEKDYKALYPRDQEKESDNKQQRLTPFDGEHAVRVGCLRCGDMEGIRQGILSSVDLGLDSVHNSFSLLELLTEYCSMETIPGVECYRCTLNDWRAKLQQKVEDLPLMAKAFRGRIDEIDNALKDKVIDEKRYASLKTNEQKSLGDKTKQTMFARPMADVLMIHINRSVFDMHTGYIRKNYAPVEFPIRLNMAQFIADPNDEANQNPAHPMTGTDEPEWYTLKAAVVHYGSANFGHYICFRKFNDFWWRISDDTVDLTTEAQVLASQGVFMLFYEREAAIPKREQHAILESDPESPEQVTVLDDETAAAPPLSPKISALDDDVNLGERVSNLNHDTQLGQPHI